MSAGSREAERAERLSSVRTPAGGFCILAIDHRDAMRNAFRRAGVEDVTVETMVATKLRIVAEVATTVSGLLLDDVTLQAMDDGPAALVPLETQGHEPCDGGRLNALLPDFGPRDARRIGAAGCKLLLYFRADHGTVAAQRDLAAAAIAGAHAEGLPLILEPLVYRLEGESEDGYAAAYPDLVVAAASGLADLGADVLKLQFPGGARPREACDSITAAVGATPWVLLGGGETGGEEFAAQLADACRAGAAGFAVGRAVWGPVLGLEPDRQRERLRDGPLQLLRQLASTVAGSSAL